MTNFSLSLRGRKIKICIVGDSHYGARSDNPYFYDYQKKFFKNILFPYIKKFEIKYLIHLGDVFHNRKYLNHQTAHRFRDDFVEPLIDSGIEAHFLVGNHDIPFKDSLNYNGLRCSPLNDNDRFHIYDEPTETEFGLMVPWICRDNRIQTMDMIRNSKSRFCYGHLELAGFEQEAGRIAKEGDDRRVFNKFDKVFSGHFHTRSSNDNIHYIGSSFNFSWGDYSDNNRGFAIFDTEIGAIKYFNNPYRIFSSLSYDEDVIPEISSVRDTFCRINRINVTDEKKFDKFLSDVKDVGTIDIRVIDADFKPLLLSEESITVSDTGEIFRSYISTLEIEKDIKESVENEFDEVYREAQNV